MTAASKPIPANPTELSQASDKLAHRQWLESVFLKPFVNGPDKDAAWMKEAESFVQEMIKHLSKDSDRPDYVALAVKGKEIIKSGCSHPLIQAMTAVLETETPNAIALGQKACEEFTAAPDKYPPLWSFWARIALSRTLVNANRNTILVKANDQLALGLLPSILSPATFPESTTNPILWIISIWDPGFFERNHESVVSIMQKSEFVPQWLTLTFKGRSETNLAWEARGSGYANTVTAEGWKGMAAHLAVARESLQKAWELDPKHPVICHAMMSVVLGSPKEDPSDEMRLWFDRATALEFDYLPVYKTMIYGLKPRWYGSHRAQLAFGEQCLKTGRFDTEVPSVFLQCLTDIVSETTDIKDFYKEKQIEADLDAMFDGYIKAPKPPKPTNYYRTYKISYSLGKEDFSQIAQLLKENGGQPDLQACEELKITPELLTIYVQNMTFTGKEDVKKAAVLRNNFKISEALPLYRKIVAYPDLSDLQKVFFTNRILSLELEEKLQTFQWVDFMPPIDLVGWTVVNGKWSRIDDYLECKSGDQGLMIFNTARILPNFEFRGEIEFVSSTNKHFQAGALWGFPKNVYGNFTCFRIKGDGMVSLSDGFREPVIDKSIPKKNQYSFVLTCYKGKYSLQIDGVPAFSSFSGKTVNPPEIPFSVGLGGFYDQNETVVRFRKLEIRQISETNSN